MSVQDWDLVEKFVSVQYETLANEGAALMIEEIMGVSGWTPSPECNTTITAPLIGGVKTYDVNMTNWITDHVDWEVERMFGYEKGARPYAGVEDVEPIAVEPSALPPIKSSIVSPPSMSPAEAAPAAPASV